VGRFREGGREGYGRRLREGVKEVQRRRRDRREGKREKVQRKTDRGSGREGMSFRERVWLGEREEERRLFRNIVRKKQNSSFQNKQVHQYRFVCLLKYILNQHSLCFFWQSKSAATATINDKRCCLITLTLLIKPIPYG